MIFIIGGSSQGKLDFARELLNVQNDSITDGAVCDFRDAFAKPVLNNLHFLIKRLLEAGQDAGDFIRQGLDLNPDITIICDELGTGVIPIAKEDRELQESVGRIQCQLAKRSDKVYRVHCSIPVLIKGNQDGL